MKLYDKKKFKALVQALDDWYGIERSREEVSAYCPEPRQAADLMEKLLKKTAGKEHEQIIKIQSNWQDIAGKQVAEHTRAVRFAGKVLYVEVAHNIWLRELATAELKSLWISKVNKLLGKKPCNDIIFSA